MEANVTIKLECRISQNMSIKSHSAVKPLFKIPKPVQKSSHTRTLNI
uniref:Uncharacterized protein n=1 Tax=Anguilla anguilla TaxID=7936 RepID=A0A0E9WE81_ANGAN